MYTMAGEQRRERERKRVQPRLQNHLIRAGWLVRPVGRVTDRVGRISDQGRVASWRDLSEMTDGATISTEHSLYHTMD